MKNFIMLTGIDSTKILVDSDRIVVAMDVVETTDRGYTQVMVNGSVGEAGIVLKVNEAVDVIRDKIFQGDYSRLGGKL